MEDEIILSVKDLGIWAFEKFRKTNKRVTCLTLGVLCLSAGGYFAVAYIMDNRKRIKDLENQVKVILMTMTSGQTPDIPVSE